MTAMQYGLRELILLMTLAPPTAVATWVAAPYVVAFMGNCFFYLGGCCSD
jgi:hypothetical protein